MKFLKYLLSVMTFTAVLSLVLAVIGYTPVADREPDIYYSSMTESFIFSMYYLAIVFIAPSILLYIIFAFLGKRTQYTVWTRGGLSILIGGSIIGTFLFLQHDNHQTDDLYLIPEGYEGDVYVFYNVKGAPKVEQEDGYDIHRINEKGYFVTSTPDLDYGTVTDKYVYVDKKGKRKPIDKKCVQIFGTSGYSSSENEEIDLKYTGLNVKKGPCDETFQTEELTGQEDSEDEVRSEVLLKYYGLEDYVRW
ncbi:hypothetical protein QFZ87_000748 [Bacillus sp. SLBN-46]|uniref:DUF6843 domain-containing protein n=1 Tax=Bacillus sp. SLBN-46 TaxID=3042283 RepID=UPI0028590F28|nr:hypothetical protein [Bacillus sp. SLBN-46]MDR6121151.1 hypothetical protein [Bacillus sp. SLBN-46]